LGPDSGVEIFVSPAQELSLEAFFEDVKLGELNAKVVLTLGLEHEILAAMASRTSKRQGSASGAWRLTLVASDLALAAQAPVVGISYLPMASLEEEVIDRLFGTPAEKAPAGEDTVSWLYPAKGLSITLDQHHKAILQYVSPDQFEQLFSTVHPASTSP
jgi:hypothetical protein